MKFLVAIISFSVALSVACSASRSASSPTPLAGTPATNQTSSPITASIVQDKPVCTLTMSGAPVIKGLRLGMTPDEVMALFPGSKDDADLRAQLSRPPTSFGGSSFVMRPEKYKNKAEFNGISQISFSVLDGRISSFTVHYPGPQWPHVDQFVTKFIDGTDLPPADQWQPYAGMDNQMKTLTCVDFAIRVFAGGEGANLNYVLLQDLEADKKLKERRKKAREQASPTPGRQ